MDQENCDLAAGLVSASYIAQGAQALAARRRMVKALLSNRRLPERGWDEATIEMLLRDAALMDSNNFPHNVGVGEREARVACPLVSRRHFGLAHGVGRSGDIAAEQPKAAGSSLLAKLGAALAGDALRVAGLEGMAAPVVLPLATGMALTLTLLAVARERGPEARHVVWSRIDQKTCLKAIAAANLVPEVVELRRDGDQLVTDLAAIEEAVGRLGPARVAAVVTTTSCFAPRACDDVVGAAKLCARLGVPHVINNAYGLGSAQICAQIAAAARRGRVDAVVQSTDKNFLVPVGGALVASPAATPAAAAGVAAAYPGRAAGGALLDLLATLLHWGAAGWRRALGAREALHPYLAARLGEVASELGERVLATPGNPISVAMTLDGLAGGGGVAEAAAGGGGGRGGGVTYFGAMLWSRGVSGTRVVARGARQAVAGLEFEDYGSHCAGGYPHAYLTAAAAVGGTEGEVDEFCVRLARAYREFGRKAARRRGRGAAPPPPPQQQEEVGGEGRQAGGGGAGGEAAR
ncbi:MAG: selenocysteine synthase [Monoraphidium minutum]|nr:MAG: selenocysteine synthase [Monoraphidium minutum]